MKEPAFTLAETLTPLDCACAKCGSPAKIYPTKEGAGACVCSDCSPAWLGSFLAFSLNSWRAEMGLDPTGAHTKGAP